MQKWKWLVYSVQFILVAVHYTLFTFTFTFALTIRLLALPFQIFKSFSEFFQDLISKYHRPTNILIPFPAHILNHGMSSGQNRNNGSNERPCRITRLYKMPFLVAKGNVVAESNVLVLGLWLLVLNDIYITRSLLLEVLYLLPISTVLLFVFWDLDCSLYMKETGALPCSSGGYPSWSLALSLIHIWRCRRYSLCRSRWSPYH